MNPYQLKGKPAYDIRRVGLSGQVGSTRPITLVSLDSHAVAPPHGYVEYMDPKIREEQGEAYLKFVELWHAAFTMFGYPASVEALDIIDTRDALRLGGELGYCDPARRIRETEADGVAAEFLHPDGPMTCVPFWNSFYSASRPELRAAGARAHNRFLADFCSHAPERLLGIRLIYPWPDMAAAIKECEAAAALGAKGIYAPFQAGVPGDPAPAYYHPSYDALWAACCDLGLAVFVHAGWGNPQGSLEAFTEAMAAPAEENNSTRLAEGLDTFIERRPLWQMAWGGVFDRFPDLRLCFTEIHGDWVPGTLAVLDARARDEPGAMKLTPSEYWQRNCLVCLTSPRYTDVAVRHEVGINRVMFGTDYPHPESTWPNTRQFLRETMRHLPEDEARLILGDNAIDHFGLNRQLLEEVAFRCGPMPAEILGEHHVVDPRLVDYFDVTGGLRKSANLHLDKLEVALEEDLTGIRQLAR